jgi:hypothetical protein
MAGMELPLLQPATPDFQPAPVVKPQSEAFQRIAAAGAEAQHTAQDIWYMNRMARMDHDEAWLNTASGKIDAAKMAVSQRIQNGEVGPDEAPAVMRKAIGDSVAPILGQSSGAFKERLMGMVNQQSDVGAQQAIIHATAENLQRQNVNFSRSVKDLVDRIPFADQADQAGLAAQLHDSIENHGAINHLPKETIQGMQADANAEVNLGLMQKMLNESPGHGLAVLTSKDFDAQNPWLGLVGGEAKKQALINQAQWTIKNGDAVSMAAFNDQRTKDINQLTAMKNAGQPIPSAMLDNMHTIGTAMKQYFSPSWKPQPPGDEGLTQHFMEQAQKVQDPIDAQNLKIRMLESNALNPRQRQMVGDAADASVKMNTTATGQAVKAGARELEDHFNPLPKGPYDMTPSKKAFNKATADRAQRDFMDATKGVTDPGQIIQIRDKIIERYDKHTEKQQKLKAETPPTMAPTAASGMSDADLVAKLGLH